jgi:hypothetical protein
MSRCTTVVAVGFLAWLAGAAPAPAQGLPDLTIDAGRLALSLDLVTRNFRRTDCVVVEGCAGHGKRRLLRFDTSTPNFGTADLVLGNPAEHPELYEFSGCHNHFHLRSYTRYTLYDVAGQVVVGRKQAFCLIDVVQYWAGYPPRFSSCANQGLSVGWADVYPKSVDCQWIDVTGVRAGNYVLEVVVDPDDLIAESNESNNVARIPVTIGKSR